MRPQEQTVSLDDGIGVRQALRVMGAPSRENIEDVLPEEGREPTEIAEALAAAARGLRYGSIEVIVHDSRVVQIVRTERRRIVK